jgi:hypothetical protein
MRDGVDVRAAENGLILNEGFEGHASGAKESAEKLGDSCDIGGNRPSGAKAQCHLLYNGDPLI